MPLSLKNTTAGIKYLCFLLLASITISSCTASKEEAYQPADIPVKDLKQKLNQNAGMIETLEAAGTISFDSPDMSNSGSFELRIRKPDSLFFKIEGPFGIDIAAALITRSDFIYYNAQENKAFTGPTTDLNIGAILKVKANFDELMNGFTGSFSFFESEEDNNNAFLENAFYMIEFLREGKKEKYLIEPEKYVINTFKKFGHGNRTLLEICYSGYDNKDSISFPGQVKIINPEKKQTVWIQYESSSINKKNLSFKLRIPKSAKIIKWN